MNAHINKFRKSQQTKLRKMQKSQPKVYWKYLNSLKTKRKTEMPSLTQFHDFFSEIYSNEEVGIDDTATHESTDNYNEFLNQPFSPSEIKKCIRKLKNSKSPGKDQILNEYLKLTKDKMLHVQCICQFFQPNLRYRSHTGRMARRQNKTDIQKQRGFDGPK